MDNQLKFIFLTLALIGMTACQGVRFNTNLTPEFAVDKYQTSQVVEYTAEEVYNHDSQMIGEVSAVYCQRINTPAPIYSSIIETLKYKVQKIGGNGIVVMECSKDNPYAACIAHLECRALAYEVNFS
ncbi:hypothetical protein L2719_20250 [Shewanella schlegeliana]|uniref:Lipoprotein n=1 Tax=Shewanella schlegeliana TaxID=190308 RepID=A0ABS1T620_9GAMM|nr:hypothetical protein [Shewanella schlegeliana]MBL4915574.1 hypothetical protein [Shewanella schlegeliana]MCL1111859.1 hypothetical protein [Shewanella schlegeliana]GIU37593.1 hypothetical protein TUM4433_38040 [Shewanella schlegeliana]